MDKKNIKYSKKEKVFYISYSLFGTLTTIPVNTITLASANNMTEDDIKDYIFKAGGYVEGYIPYFKNYKDAETFIALLII